MEIIEAGSVSGELTKFEKAVDLMEGVETIPVVAQRLVSLTANPDASFTDIERLISSDMALTARVLRIASSPLYCSIPAKNLQSAIVRLGLKEVRNLALTMMVGAKSTDRFQRDLWDYALETAVLSETLANMLGKDRFLEPFVCGLLHDLGAVVMSKIDGASYRKVVNKLGTHEQVQRELAVYGFTHCDIGAMAAERWKLFEGLEQVIQFHYEPLSAEALEFPESVLATIQLVALASRIATNSEEALVSETGLKLMERLGTSAVEVVDEFGKAQRRIEDFMALLR